MIIATALVFFCWCRELMLSCFSSSEVELEVDPCAATPPPFRPPSQRRPRQPRQAATHARRRNRCPSTARRRHQAASSASRKACQDEAAASSEARPPSSSRARPDPLPATRAAAPPLRCPACRGSDVPPRPDPRRHGERHGSRHPVPRPRCQLPDRAPRVREADRAVPSDPRAPRFSRAGSRRPPKGRPRCGPQARPRRVRAAAPRTFRARARSLGKPRHAPADIRPPSASPSRGAAAGGSARPHPRRPEHEAGTTTPSHGRHSAERSHSPRWRIQTPRARTVDAASRPPPCRCRTTPACACAERRRAPGAPSPPPSRPPSAPRSRAGRQTPSSRASAGPLRCSCAMLGTSRHRTTRAPRTTRWGSAP
mmetsp:Transcript_9218/g.20895  ORF Transcript_9218/g.20895 Transcript_9218/m.20895 type:complete len:368 (+) Transcript_9218:38-1141(+)